VEDHLALLMVIFLTSVLGWHNLIICHLGKFLLITTIFITAS
jgi:hypothetical protein